MKRGKEGTGTEGHGNNVTVAVRLSFLCSAEGRSVGGRLSAPMRGEGEGEDGGVETSSMGGSTSMLLLPILIFKVIVCKLCGCKCNDPNPLDNDKDDRYGGLRPWLYYKKNKDKTAKSPEGRYCMICFNVYKALGLDLKHAGCSAFYKWASNPVERLHQFQRSVGHWIKKHNSGEITRLRDRRGLEGAQTVETGRKTGLKRKQDLVFVELEKYIEDFGKPEDNGDNIEEAEIDGKTTRGVWVLGENEKKGYHRFENYEDKHVLHKVQVEDGKDMLSKDQAADKYNTVANQFLDDSKKKKEQAKSSMDQLLVLTHKLNPEQQQADHDERSDSDLSAESEKDSEDGPSQDDDDEDVGASSAMKALFAMSSATKPSSATSPAKVGSKAVARATSKPLNLAATPTKRSTSPGPTEVGLDSAKNKKQKRSTPAPREVAALDGRGERVVEAVRKAMADMDAQVELCVDLGTMCTGSNTADAEQGFKAAVVKHITDANTVLAKIKDTLTRIDRSKAKSHLAEESQELKDKEQAVRASLEFCKLLKVNKAPPDNVIKAIKQCRDMGVKLSSSLHIREFTAEIKTCIQYEQYEKLCTEVLCKSGTTCIATLESVWGIAPHAIHEAGRAAIEESLMNSFRVLKEAKDKDQKEYKSTIDSLLALSDHFSAQREGFYMADMKSDIADLARVLAPERFEVGDLRDTLTRLDLAKVSSNEDAQDDSRSGIMLALASHAAFSTLTEALRITLDDREAEVGLGEVLREK